MLVGAGTVDTPAEGSYAYFIYYIAALAERTKAEIVSVSVEMTSANPQEVRNTPHLHRFHSSKRSLCQDRLGTNIAKMFSKSSCGFRRRTSAN